jgi:hypothetical protein
MLRATLADAGTPTVVWQKSGVQTGDSTIFSTDGTALLLAVTGGFELRRASDGVLLNTLTLPVDSRGYDAKALSSDKTLVALSFLRNGAGTIELWRIAGSTLSRTIATDAVRTIKGLAFSSTGLIASRERFAYGGGGNLRVHRVSDGALVKKAGPVARNSASGGVGFSADGKYLAVNDNNQNGLWILRTSDWGTARLIGDGATLFAWADNTSVWTGSFQRVRVTDGVVLATFPFNDFSLPSAFTPDNRFAYAWDIVDFTASNTIRFLRVADGGTQLVYTFPSGTRVWSDKINSTQTLFIYEICPSDCTVYVASMPSL